MLGGHGHRTFPLPSLWWSHGFSAECLFSCIPPHRSRSATEDILRGSPVRRATPKDVQNWPIWSWPHLIRGPQQSPYLSSLHHLLPSRLVQGKQHPCRLQPFVLPRWRISLIPSSSEICILATASYADLTPYSLAYGGLSFRVGGATSATSAGLNDY